MNKELSVISLLLLAGCYPNFPPEPIECAEPRVIYVTPETYKPFSQERYRYPRYEQEADNPYQPNSYGAPRYYTPYNYRPYSAYPRYDPSADNPYYAPPSRKPSQKKPLFDTPFYTE